MELIQVSFDCVEGVMSDWFGSLGRVGLLILNEYGEIDKMQAFLDLRSHLDQPSASSQLEDHGKLWGSE